MTGDSLPSEAERKPRAEVVRYHEAGHAAVIWNVGIAVDRVIADRVRSSGYVMPGSERPVDYSISRRIAYILGCLIKSQVNRTHKSLPESRKAVRSCRQAVTEIEIELPNLLLEAVRSAPVMAARAGYAELLAADLARPASRGDF